MCTAIMYNSFTDKVFFGSKQFNRKPGELELIDYRVYFAQYQFRMVLMKITSILYLVDQLQI